MPDTDIKLAIAATSAGHPTITVHMDSGVSQSAAGHSNSSQLLKISAKTAGHDCTGADAAADKRWVGSLVCLATALGSASLLVWLILLIVG